MKKTALVTGSSRGIGAAIAALLARSGWSVCINYLEQKEKAEALLTVLRQGKYSESAAIIGEVTDDHKGRVVVRTPIGSETLLPPPGGELLPRIC